MEHHLTFETLPKGTAVKLFEEIASIKELLLKSNNHQSNPEQDKLLSVQQAAEFLNLSTPTIYSKVSKGAIPFMKRSKRLYFSKIELMEYLKGGKNNTSSEISEVLDDLLSSK